MGSYIPSKRRKAKSVAETLAEAESDHFLDCPDAELRFRFGAALLDAIFLYILWSAANHVANFIIHTPYLNLSDIISYEWKVGFTLAKIGLGCLLLYSVCLWPVAFYGGSPGKLLLGLIIVDSDTGQLLSFPQVFIREVFGKIFCGAVTISLSLVLPVVRSDRRALQDLISRSVVKRMH